MPTAENKSVRPPSAVASAAFAVGLVAIYVGERVIGVGTARGVLTGLGAALVLAAFALRGLRIARLGGDEGPRIERILLGTTALGAVALALYFAESDLAAPLFGGKALSASSPKIATALSALWPALLFTASLPLLLAELAYASMARAPRFEVGRVRDAALSGFGVAGALVAAFALSYVAAERDHKWDLSYFRTARPGEATRKLVRSLDQNVTIAYFFPPASEVREEVKSYLDDLAKESPKLEVRSYDQAVDPAKARELGVSGNGMVVVARGARHEQLALDPDLEKARTQLRDLDKQVQKRLLAIAKPGRTVYLTVGHGERMADPANDTDKRFTIRSLRQLLQDQSYTLRDLGAAEGLATDVPADAGVVMIVGPTKAFLPEEAAAIKRFIERGGRLFVALDPEAGLDYADLLGPLGLTYSPVQLANDAVYARRTYQDSDRVNLVTNSFSSHASVSTLGRLRAPIIFPGVGALAEAKDRPKNASVIFTVHALATTWNDKNGNFAFDAKDGEQRKAWELAAAVTCKRDAANVKKAGENDEGRALVVGDSDAISDGVIGNVGNPYFLVDSMKWLIGDEALVGETTSEQDVPIQHTKAQDAAWFYSTIFAAPALVLLAGWLATRRRKRRARGGAPSTGAGATTDGAGKEAA